MIYIPGNHDAAFLDYAGLAFGNIGIALEATRVTADQRRFLVVHGRQVRSLAWVPPDLKIDECPQNRMSQPCH